MAPLSNFCSFGAVASHAKIIYALNMKKIIKLLALVVGLAGLCLVAFTAFCFIVFSQRLEEKFPMHHELAGRNGPTSQEQRDLGERIYFVRNGCVDCHGADLAGVKIMENAAMGSIYGANITPYKTRGMKDEDLMRAIRYGVHSSGRSLRFMPSFDFAGLSRSDTLALISFMRSVPAVEKEDHVNTWGPMVKILSTLGKMPVMFPAGSIDHFKDFAIKPEEGATIEFGKYLANSCVGCHGENLAGGPIPGGDPSWPLATSLRFGANGWTRADFDKVIQSGISHVTGQQVRPPMPMAALQQMTKMELDALWLYLSGQ